MQELVREDYVDLFKLLEEESSVYKVLLVRMTDAEDLDFNISEDLLANFTSESEYQEIDPSSLLEQPGVSTAAWEMISGEEVKRIAEPYDFFQDISGLESRWIKVPEQKAFIYLVDFEPVSSGKDLIENDAIYADARALMWKRILETNIYKIYASMDVMIKIPDVSLGRLIYSSGPGSVLKNVFGVPTGWKYEFIGYDVSLEEFLR